MIGPRRHYLVLKALEPIAHGDTLTGVRNATNTRLFMRSAAYLHGRAARIPDISENALRSVMFRYPLHDHLLQVLGIQRGTIPQGVMNLLFSGGSVASQASEPENSFALGHAVKRHYPSLDLLGGAVDCFILPRSRLRLAAWPMTREYAELIAQVRPDYREEANRVSIFDLIMEEVRTRGTGDESHGNQMLYEYETLAAGTQVLVELTLDAHTPPATEAAIAVALQQWDGYFGGQGRQGRGRLAIMDGPAIEAEPYLAHLSARAETMRAGLVDGTLGTGQVLCFR
jgi:hypothetical protein